MHASLVEIPPRGHPARRGTRLCRRAWTGALEDLRRRYTDLHLRLRPCAEAGDGVAERRAAPEGLLRHGDLSRDIRGGATAVIRGGAAAQIWLRAAGRQPEEASARQ